MLTIADVLSPDDLAKAREVLAAAPFGEGRRTAHGPARKVKANAQADGADPKVAALGRFVRKALERHPVFMLYARPARWSAVMFSRYRGGDAYGFHIDEPVMGAEGARLRTDLSFTLFLSEPSSYEGGALLIDGLDGEREVKPAAGSVVLYPTGALHRVEPVASGERLAAVGWLQSLIRRGDEREILFDLGRVRAGLPDGEGRLTLDKAMASLVRLWGEP